MGIQDSIDPFELLSSRGRPAAGLQKEFATRLARAVLAAEAATGKRAALTSTFRSPEEQAQLYANYKQTPISWGGKTYAPGAKGGLAAAPGKSRHGRGEATDLAAGPVLDYIKAHAGEFGIEGLPGHAGQIDPGHLQLAGMSHGPTDRTRLPPKVQQIIAGDNAVEQPSVSHTSVEHVVTPEEFQKLNYPGGVEGPRRLREIARQTGQAFEDQSKQLAQGGVEFAGMPWALASGVAGLAEGVGEGVDYLAGYKWPDDTVRPSQWLAERGRAGSDEFAKAADIGDPNGWIQQLERTLAPSMVGGSPIATAAIDVATNVVPSVVEELFGAPEAQADPMTKMLTDPTPIEQQPTEMVTTPTGPVTLTTKDKWMLAGTGIATLGMMFAPALIGKMRTTKAPGLVEVKDIPGLFSGGSVDDLARTYDDVNAGVLRYAGRFIPPQAQKYLEETLYTKSRGAAQAVADSAVAHGRAELPGLQFRVPVSLKSLHQLDNAETTAYLQTWNALDRIREVENIQAAQMAKLKSPTAIASAQAKQIAAGPVRFHDMTHADALTSINRMERVNPQLKQIRTAYRQNYAELVRYENTGEYATVSKKRRRMLMQNRSNFVPTRTGRAEPLDTELPTMQLAEHMQHRVRARLENETRGAFVDTVRRAEPTLFKKVKDRKEFDDHPSWKDRAIIFKRRGKEEIWLTDKFFADTMRMDPYSVAMGGQIFYGAKRLLEAGTTGKLAPWFAVTSAARSYQIGKQVAPWTVDPILGIPYPRSTGPSALGTVLAIPQQLIPQAAEVIAASLDRGSGGWLTSKLGIPPQALTGVARSLHSLWENSLVAQMEFNGSFRGSILQQQKIRTAAQSQLQAAAAAATGPFKGLLSAYAATLDSIHNAPGFNYAMKNRRRMPIDKLTAVARHMTGDPRVGGEYYTTIDGQKAPIRAPDSVTQTKGGSDAAWLADKYGMAHEAGRVAIPWFNYTVQGMKRIAESYVKNPVAFTSKMWLYTMAPAASLFYYRHALGKDPNGIDYNEYAENRRSAYNRQMNWYIPIKGKPAEEGIEFPRFHEMTIFARGMEVLLNHLHKTNYFSLGEDAAQAAAMFGNVALMPPSPPLLDATLASKGIQPPQGGVFGNQEAYKKREQAFDQLGSQLPTWLEMTARALSGGIVDVVVSSATAFTSTPDADGNVTAMVNALKEGAMTAARKAPLVRDIVGVPPRMSADTPKGRELWARQDEIDQLEEFYRKWVKDDGEVGVKAASKTGAAITKGVMNDFYRTDMGMDEQTAAVRTQTLPEQPAGPTQPPPTNPLFNLFVQKMHNVFQTDTKDVNADGSPGFQGYKSLWRRYGDASEHIRRAKNVNTGNAVSWKKTMEQRYPDQIRYLKENGVDYRRPDSVRAFYEKIRQDTASVILSYIRQVEDEISQEAGFPIKLKNLDPYGKVQGAEMAPWKSSGLPSGGMNDLGPIPAPSQ